jgi:general secretion pathway protein F
MPAFSYRAVDAAGKQSKGVIEAASLPGARRALRERALLPLLVEASASGAQPAMQGGGFRMDRLFRKSLNPRALATVTRQLSTLVGSDIRIEEALRLVAAQAEHPAVNSLLLDVRGAILDGRSLAGALEGHPAAFPEYFRASIAAGEQSGQLADVLAHLADFVETRHRANQKVKLALLYPALLASVSAGMMILLMVYVVPDIVRVFVSRGADLPFLTRALIGLSGFVTSFGWLLAIMAVAASWFARRWLREPANRLATDRFLATRRPFARFSRQTNAARFSATLATLVQSAVPLVDALAAAAAVTPNRYIRAQALGITTRVREGGSLHGAMGDSGAFPSMLVAIVASGETGGKLGPALGRAAAELDREVEAQVAVMVALVEPAVLLLMGGMVLLMVLAILLPIVGLNDLVVS